jgi:hypothetical protein
MNCFLTKSCDDLEDYFTKIKPLLNQGWIFRGQQKSSWVLENRFERACERFDVLAKNRLKVERAMIREFQRRLHQYETNIPSNNAIDEWMALMQHHGAPTRLLDFTYSPYVAAYFAFEFAFSDSNVAVWAVNAGWFSDHLKDISQDLFFKNRQYRNYRREYSKYFTEIFMMRIPKKFILVVNPFRLNERLAFQRGVFLCPGDARASFMDNFSTYGINDLRQNVIKFIVQTGKNNENTIQVLEILDSMNISRITLFPGLDGFAQSFEPRIKSLFERQSHH